MLPLDCKNLEVPEEDSESSVFTVAAMVIISATLFFIIGIQMGIHEGRQLEQKEQRDRNERAAQVIIKN